MVDHGDRQDYSPQDEIGGILLASPFWWSQASHFQKGTPLTSMKMASRVVCGLLSGCTTYVGVIWDLASTYHSCGGTHAVGFLRYMAFHKKNAETRIEKNANSSTIPSHFRVQLAA